MIVKALEYTKGTGKKIILGFRTVAGEDLEEEQRVFAGAYVLRKKSRWPELKDSLIDRYEQARRGEVPDRCEARAAAPGASKKAVFDKVRDVCQSMHKVFLAAEVFGDNQPNSTRYRKSCLPCRLNPLELWCTCKGFRHHCICSHVLAVTHRRGSIDLNAELAPLAPRREAHRPRQAVGGQHIQPDDGANAAPRRDGRAEEQDVERM